jgi:hypothetical protein
VILGILRIAWLRLTANIFGAWLDPLARLALAAVIGFALVLLVARVWYPPKSAVESAAVEAIEQRQEIERANVDEEKRDNEWVRHYEAWQQAGRERANTDGADAVLWRSDDPWLRRQSAAR